MSRRLSEMAASKATCAHCGKEGVGFQRCSTCKQISYCGAQCQKAAWKGHKKICAKPRPATELLRGVVRDTPTHEVDALESLIDALFKTNAIDEAEPLVKRYRDAAEAMKGKAGLLCLTRAKSLLASARLHEARFRPREAAKEVRAILDVLRLMRHRETNSDVEKVAWAFAAVLLQAGTQLTVLSPAGGEEELVTAVAVEVARLGACEGAMRDMEFGGGRRFAPAIPPMYHGTPPQLLSRINRVDEADPYDLPGLVPMVSKVEDPDDLPPLELVSEMDEASMHILAAHLDDTSPLNLKASDLSISGEESDDDLPGLVPLPQPRTF